MAAFIFKDKETKLPLPCAKKLPSTWKGFNLLNMFYKSADERDSCFKEIEFKMLSDWGFNFVRIPIDYRILTEKNDWYKFNEDAMNRMDKVIEYGIKHDIHVNLNLHRAPGFTVASPKEETDLWTQEKPQKAFASMWAYFAERYKTVPLEFLSFDLVNEPTDVEESVYVSVMKKAADSIWAATPSRLVIADGLNYGRIPCKSLKDMGIAQAARGYEPFTLTHYKAGWVEGSDKYPLPLWPFNPEEEGVPGNKEMLKEMYKPWLELKNSGCGVMIGEWGAHNRTPHDVVLRWMQDILEVYKELCFGWAVWGLTGSFGILNSARKDVEYENCNGYKLDRKMLELLQKYI